MNCVQSLFLIQKILLSVSLAWSQMKARFPIPTLRAVLFPWDSVTGRMQPLNSRNIKILTAIKKLWSEKWNSPINKRHLWSSLSSPFRESFNWQQLQTILCSIRFFARKGLPICCHDNEQSNFFNSWMSMANRIHQSPSGWKRNKANSHPQTSRGRYYKWWR